MDGPSVRAQVGGDGRAAYTYAAVRPARAPHFHALLIEPSGACDIIPAVHAIVARHGSLNDGEFGFLVSSSRTKRISLLTALALRCIMYAHWRFGLFRSLLYTLACIPCRVASTLYTLVEDYKSTNERLISSSSDKKGWDSHVRAGAALAAEGTV